MKFIVPALVIATLGLAHTAHADEAAAAKPADPAPAKSGGKYGLAGCGLGSVFFGDGSPVLAATTNGSSSNQTFGITSGTSNCVKTDGGAASARAFVQTNRSALSKEIARGRGESIASLSQLAGCSDSAAVGKALQRQFKLIFPSARASDQSVSDAVITTLRAAPLQCKKLATAG